MTHEPRFVTTIGALSVWCPAHWVTAASLNTCVGHTSAVSTAPESEPGGPSAAEQAAARAGGREPRASWLGALVDAAAATLKRAPGVTASLSATERELARVEELIWRELRHRLDMTPTGSEASPDALRDMLARLLTISIEESAQEARARWFLQLLGQLHPDEARILAALSDGTQYPVISVAARGSRGMAGPVVLENASTVGRAAGVALPDWVPAYVTHLRHLQLVSVGAESRALYDGYEILLTEAVVRQAQIDAGRHSRILRHSLRLSRLGRDLWDTCSAPQHPLRRPPSSPEW